jgi:hypothetical protein
VVAIRVGTNPGRHLVGFDGPGETIELTLTARDRSACAAGVVAAADWLLAEPRPASTRSRRSSTRRLPPRRRSPWRPADPPPPRRIHGTRLSKESSR